MNDTRPLPPHPDRPQQSLYGAPQGGFPPYPAAAPQRRRPRGWLAAVGGGLAGAALGAAVAVPVALHADGPDTPSSGTSSQQAPTSGGFADLLDRGSSGTESTADGEEPSDAGVLVVDTLVPGGAGAGTAMVLTDDGVAVTNYHVVDGSSTVRVTVASTGEEYDADVVGYDQEADVAVLQLDDASGLDTVTLDDDGGVELGDQITALGNASGQGYLSAVSGEVTSLDEDITTTDQATGSETAITGLIETTADVVPGYSGGPMFDDEGEVVGISTAAAATNGQRSPMATPALQDEDGGGTSYARPIDEALDVVELVVSDQEGDGVVIGPAAYLGVGIDPTADGVLVAQAEPGTPAADAGIAAGDAITSVDGEEVASYDELAAAVAEHEPGDEVDVTWTDASGAEQSAEVTLGESPLN
ncbi:S1C family serine protease [Nocardioides sp. CPCC 205120]|uniref:S1C family serine protease n=1 Tax=Nocardioides sp. CPCC 205120 TaxID=3406462 RepID=UPI003B50EB5C